MSLVAATDGVLRAIEVCFSFSRFDANTSSSHALQAVVSIRNEHDWIEYFRSEIVLATSNPSFHRSCIIPQSHHNSSFRLSLIGYRTKSDVQSHSIRDWIGKSRGFVSSNDYDGRSWIPCCDSYDLGVLFFDLSQSFALPVTIFSAKLRSGPLSEVTTINGHLSFTHCPLLITFEATLDSKATVCDGGIKSFLRFSSMNSADDRQLLHHTQVEGSATSPSDPNALERHKNTIIHWRPSFMSFRSFMSMKKSDKILLELFSGASSDSEAIHSDPYLLDKASFSRQISLADLLRVDGVTFQINLSNLATTDRSLLSTNRGTLSIKTSVVWLKVKPNLLPPCIFFTAMTQISHPHLPQYVNYPQFLRLAAINSKIPLTPSTAQVSGRNSPGPHFLRQRSESQASLKQKDLHSRSSSNNLSDIIPSRPGSTSDLSRQKKIEQKSSRPQSQSSFSLNELSRTTVSTKTLPKNRPSSPIHRPGSANGSFHLAFQNQRRQSVSPALLFDGPGSDMLDLQERRLISSLSKPASERTWNELKLIAETLSHFESMKGMSQMVWFELAKAGQHAFVEEGTILCDQDAMYSSWIIIVRGQLCCRRVHDASVERVHAVMRLSKEEDFPVNSLEVIEKNTLQAQYCPGAHAALRERAELLQSIGLNVKRPVSSRGIVHSGFGDFGVVTYRKEGQSQGDFCMALAKPSNVQVSAVTPCHLLFVPKQDYDRLVKHVHQYQHEQYVRFFQKHPDFGGWTSDSLSRLVSAMTVENFTKGQVVISAGDKPSNRALCFVYEGRAEISKSAVVQIKPPNVAPVVGYDDKLHLFARKEHIIQQKTRVPLISIEAGDYFGLMILAGELVQDHPFSVTAKDNLVVLSLSCAESFRQLKIGPEEVNRSVYKIRERLAQYGTNAFRIQHTFEEGEKAKRWDSYKTKLVEDVVSRPRGLYGII
eukprot:TRINITY_DN11120_c0_g1_i1.p1 TRINITY_DN11120_c0_g1~~TRINITY_DN11120_c0_g1_i1.p1  ORF type:complete len:936 (+),score=161.18 TRINITY_DN11120_c0_g1_i1:38-2845(+)